MAANTYGRQVIVPLTNKSGGAVAAGDVVVIDTGNNVAFTTTTSAGFTGGVGVAQEAIASNAVGRVLTQGYAALVNVSASVTRGDFGKTHTVAKQAVDVGANRTVGTFCQFLTGGTTPDALVFPVDLGGTALTNPMTTAGDIIVGGVSGAPARLAAVAVGKLLGSAGTGTAPAYTAATALLLDYALAADHSNQALTAGTAFDFFANQNFTVVSATSLIQVSVQGYCFCNDASTNQYMTRVNIDSAGTPVLRYIGGASNTNVVTSNRTNPLAGGPVWVSGLSVGVHTLKVQIISTGNDHLFCRASTNGPTTGAEFLNVQVIEHL